MNCLSLLLLLLIQTVFCKDAPPIKNKSDFLNSLKFDNKGYQQAHKRYSVTTLSNSNQGLFDVTYIKDSFIIVKNLPFVIYPEYDSANILYEIYSGSLPSGLFLDTEDGSIYGYPNQVVTQNTTIRIYNTTHSITRELSFEVIENKDSCTGSQVPISILRTFKDYAFEEGFHIYRGSDNTLIYTQPHGFSGHQNLYGVCVDPGMNLLELTDSYGDGWTNGSSIIISVGTFILGPYHLSSGSNQVIQFTIPVIEPVTSCESTQTLVKITRITQDYSQEEVVLIYKDSKSLDKLAYILPVVSDFKQRLFSICLDHGNYILSLLDMGGDGWRLQSSLELLYNSITETYKLYYGIEENISFVLKAPVDYSNQGYVRSRYTLLRDVYVDISPKGSVNYSLFSGYLPTGLTFSNGIIYGTPTAVISYAEVTVQLFSYSSSESSYQTLIFSVFDNPTECAYDQTLVTITRTGKLNLAEESFALYEGKDTTGYEIFVQPFVSSARTYTWYVCLKPMYYTIQLTDYGKNGWYTASLVTLSYGNFQKSFQLTSGEESIQTFAIESGNSMSSCPFGQSLVSLIRSSKENTNQESFAIFEGLDALGPLVYSQPAINDNGSYTWNVCLNYGSHVVQLTSSTESGWQADSSLVIQNKDTQIGKFHLDQGTEVTYVIEIGNYSILYISLLIGLGILLLSIVIYVFVVTTREVMKKRKRQLQKQKNQPNVPKAVPMQPINTVLPVNSVNTVNTMNTVMPMNTLLPVNSVNTVSMVIPGNSLMSVNSVSSLNSQNAVIPTNTVIPMNTMIPVNTVNTFIPMNAAIPINTAIPTMNTIILPMNSNVV